MEINISFTKEEKIEALEKLNSALGRCLSSSDELSNAEVLSLSKLACSVNTALMELKKNEAN